MSDHMMIVAMPEPSPTSESQNHRSRDCEGEQTTTASRVLGGKEIQGSMTKTPRQLSNPEKRSPEPVYHGRRPHHKSRTGCANCKRRRIKCDETKPDCRKCQMFGISCDYLATPAQSPDLSLIQYTPKADITEPSPVPRSLSDLGSRINEVLNLADPSDDQSGTHHKSMTSDTIKYLHHFITVLVSEDHSSQRDIVDVMTGVMVQEAFTSPHLMHAILGAGATHFRRFSPDGTLYKAVEGYHWHNAIRIYKKELTSQIGLHNMNAMLSTCILLAAMAYAGEEYKPADSWVFSSDPTALNWLFLQGGLRCILPYTTPYLEQCIWSKVFMVSDDEYQILNNHTPGREGLHPGLADLCGINETTTEDDNPYHWPLRMLSPLLELDSVRENGVKMNSFAVRLLPEFTNLLLQKDARAIVILGFWLGKMCLLKHQWFNARFLAECMAICMYLENSDDSRILKLLEFPAECCGYLLRHVREDAVFVANFDLIGLF